MPTYITGTVITAASLNNREAIRRFLAIGNLAAIAESAQPIDMFLLPSAMTIEAIDVICPGATASGSVEIDLLSATTSGGSLTSLYTSNTKPSLTLAGGVSFATFTGANLPNTTSLAAGTILACKITAAPSNCEDLIVIVR
jgi:hypothetical protein